MSGYETEELTRIEAALDDLVSPTSEDVFQATRPYDERAIASVAAKRAGGGGGGSLPSLDNVGFAYAGLGAGSYDTLTVAAPGYTLTAGQLGMDRLAGTDLSVVDDVSDGPTIVSAAGGLFGATVFLLSPGTDKLTFDGGSDLCRYLQVGYVTDGPLGFVGCDAMIPLGPPFLEVNDGGPPAAMFPATPALVAPGGRVVYRIKVGAHGLTGTDEVADPIRQLSISVWQIT